MRLRRLQYTASRWLRQVRPDPNWLDGVRVIVPVHNAAPYLGITLRFYRDVLRVPVTVFVDSKTTDDSFRIASEFAEQVQIVENRATRVGEIIERMSRLAQSRWVLRLDDDELPSIELMRYVGRAIQDRSVHAYAILRHQCAVSRSGELLRHRGYNDHIQWRLYQPDHMRYVTYGHTPGFKLPNARQQAPDEACMIHLDWAVHSYDQRLEKVQRYDAHTTDHGSIFRKFYLHEEDPDALSMLDPLPLPEFAQLSRDLRERFPELCVDPTGPQ